MKGFFQFLTTVLVAMVISCALNSLFMELGLAAKMMPSSMGTTVTGTAPSPTSPNRKDSMYGDFNVTDQSSRPSAHTVGVVDDQKDRQLEFPTSW